MKKIISLILTFIICASCCTVLLGVIASGTESPLTAYEFANEISGMISSADISSSLPACDADSCSGCNHKDFENCRLIIKSKYKIDKLDSISIIGGYDNLWIVQFSNPHSANEAYNYYNSKSTVEFVEPDKSVVLSMPDSEYVSPLSEDEKEYHSWGSEYVGFDKLNESLAGKTSKLEDTVVAVVDSGVDPDHPLLKGRVVPTRINVTSSGKRNSSDDDLGHGTQVAGIIADNTVEKIYIKPYKVIDFRGHGTAVTVAAGINCAVSDGVDVINVSIGFEEDSEVLKAAIDNAEAKGITVIGAAGNDGAETLYYPASYESVIKVTAVNNMGILANFSTHGNGVDFAAPGVKITTSTLNDRYIDVDGTSFAAPFVSAAAATIKLSNKDASPEDIINILSDYSHLPAEYHAEEKYGRGIIKVPIYNESFGSLTKTETPYFSLDDGLYRNNIELTIFCDTPDSVIYYTNDKSMPTKTNPNAVIYDGNPIELSQTAVITAVAYSDGKFRSEINIFEAIIAPYPDNNELIINEHGIITAYSGEKTSISIPEAVSGIKVTGIGDEVFKNTDMTEVILGNDVKSIGNSAFEGCKKLKTVIGLNVEEIGDRAFFDCINFCNLYFENLKEIGSYCFYNVCSNKNLINGITFHLDLTCLQDIPEGAFKNSAVSSIKLDRINKIGKNAFSECNALISFYAAYINDIPEGAFKGLKELKTVKIDDLSYIPSACFSTCSELIQIEIPKAEMINSTAFEYCSSLLSADLSAAETVFSNAFHGCTSLRELILPSMTGFNESVYSAQNPNISLPENLETFRAEKLQRTVRDMFASCKNIKNIHLNSATEIREYTFRGCNNIFFINIESVTSLNKNALAYCTAEFIDARSLESTASLPDNSGILLSNNFYESTYNSNNLTVYGTPGTFIERYSAKKGYKFIGIPLIYNEIPEYITENSETVYINAIGFNLEYQWYSNTVNSTEGATPIAGATDSFYTFTESDKAPFYFCKIKQTDMEKISYITTNIIIKDTTPADYTEYEKAVAEASLINRNFYENIFILDEALAVNVYNRYSCEQDIVDAQTKAILDAIAALTVKGVKYVTLRSSNTDLKLFENIKIIPYIDPIDASYGKIEWYTDKEDVLLVTKNGNIICIGNGIANVYAQVTNADGSNIIGVITIYCELNSIEEFLAIFISPFIKLAYLISNK